MIESFHIIISINRKGQDSIPCQALIFQVLFTRILKDLCKDISKKDPRRSSKDFHQGMDRMPRFLSCFHVGNERSCFRHIPVITFPFFLVSVTFLVTYSSFFF